MTRNTFGQIQILPIWFNRSKTVLLASKKLNIHKLIRSILMQNRLNTTKILLNYIFTAYIHRYC